LQNFPEEKVREEVRRLLEEKDSYQAAAKEALKKVVQEKVEAVVKLKDIERCVFQPFDQNFNKQFKTQHGKNNQMQIFVHQCQFLFEMECC